MALQKSEVIWMNGQWLPWDDAKIHVLSHVVHYGSSGVRGDPRLQAPRGPGHLPARGAHRGASSTRRRSTGWSRVTRPRNCRASASRSSPATSSSRLHPPADLPRLRQPRRQPDRQPGRRDGRRLSRGASTWGPTRWRRASRCRSRSWRRAAPDTFPAMAKAGGELHELAADQDRGDRQRLRRGHRARRARLRSARARARTCSSSTRASSTPRRCRPRSSPASPATPCLPSPRTWDSGARGVHAARDAVPRRRGVLLRHRGGDHADHARSTASRSATASAARSRARCRRRSSTWSRAGPRTRAAGSRRSAAAPGDARPAANCLMAESGLDALAPARSRDPRGDRSPRSAVSARRSSSSPRENFPSPAVLEAMATVAQQQVRRGLPRQALLRRLRVRRRGRDAGPRAREAALRAPSTPTCSRTRGRRPTWPRTSPSPTPGATLLGMSLAHGGHLTHGHPVSFSGRFFKVVPVRRAPEDDRHRLRRDGAARATSTARRILVAGASAYPRTIDFARFAAAARRGGGEARGRHGAHRRAGGGGAAPERRCRTPTSSPPPRTRRCAARAAASCCAAPSTPGRSTSRCSPGVQGGPLMHVIAAKAVCFGEALTPGFVGLPEAGGRQRAGAGARAARGAASSSSRAAPTITCCSSTCARRASPARWPRRRCERARITVEQERDPLRPAEADGHQRHPHRHARGHHAAA